MLLSSKSGQALPLLEAQTGSLLFTSRHPLLLRVSRNRLWSIECRRGDRLHQECNVHSSQSKCRAFRPRISLPGETRTRPVCAVHDPVVIDCHSTYLQSLKSSCLNSAMPNLLAFLCPQVSLPAAAASRDRKKASTSFKCKVKSNDGVICCSCP